MSRVMSRVRRVPDRGSATVLVLAVATLAVAVATVVALGGAVLHAGARARTAADLAALAAADAFAGGTEPCAAARTVATRNAAVLVRCSPGADGVTVLVEVRLPVVGRPVRASARAVPGPLGAFGPRGPRGPLGPLDPRGAPPGVARAPPG